MIPFVIVALDSHLPSRNITTAQPNCNVASLDIPPLDVSHLYRSNLPIISVTHYVGNKLTIYTLGALATWIFTLHRQWHIQIKAINSPNTSQVNRPNINYLYIKT